MRGRGRGDQASRGRGANMRVPPRPAALPPAPPEMPAGFVPSGGASAAPSTVEEEVEDPYDPFEPNDYMAIQQERDQRRARERREKQRQLHLERIEMEQAKVAEERRDQAKELKKAEVSNLPAWVKQPRRQGAAAPAESKTPRRAQPTRVLVIKNVVAPGEADADLANEMRLECAKHAPVEACRVHELPDVDDAVRVFVTFRNKNDARKAFVKFEGRFYGGRRLACEFADDPQGDPRGDDPPICR